MVEFKAINGVHLGDMCIDNALLIIILYIIACFVMSHSFLNKIIDEYFTKSHSTEYFTI